ncbi:hypothetical protein BGZ83_009558, partial [Gryganskiella cystojenkinii]
NVLKPIHDALVAPIPTQSQEQESVRRGSSESVRPSSSMTSSSLSGQGGGLLTWHYFLFSEDSDSPSQLASSKAILEESRGTQDDLSSLPFDVILNDLYSTHILAMTAKDHQKDHGQFYTPPKVVEFMWTRAVSGREGKLLDRFFEFVANGHNNGGGFEMDPIQDSQVPALIPKALDPCLGVSTFLSCYVRMLINEAHDRRLQSRRLEEKEINTSDAASSFALLWDSKVELQMLLNQICEHVWGLELDGFAYWMARCGVIASLMPLVQRIKSLSPLVDTTFAPKAQELRSPLFSATTDETKLPRLHLFCNDTLQLTIPKNQHEGVAANDDKSIVWEQEQILRLRDPSRLLFDFIVTNPPYMIRKTGTFSAPDPLIYDWGVLGAAGSSASFPGSLSASEKGAVVDPPEAAFHNDFVSGDTEVPSTTSKPRQTESPKTIKSRHGSSARGMMQAYGAWLFENCLMDEFYQFEPFKVFAKVQTDSLIFKVRSMSTASRERQPYLDRKEVQDNHNDHCTIFLRHQERHRTLGEILRDYGEVMNNLDSSAGSLSDNSTLSSTIEISRKTRRELQESIAPPLSTSITEDDSPSRAVGRMQGGGWTYSFAPMMPTSNLTEYMLQLTRDLGGLCSAGTKKQQRAKALEPLLWHRGPNTNPVYGLVVRMEYAQSTFGSTMVKRWFHPALYWNGKNSPQEGAEESKIVPAKALHKEGQFWRTRDRLRLSKKEGSPAESYLVPNYGTVDIDSDSLLSSVHQRQRYALCMIDKESVKLLKRQKEEGVEGAQALWNYLVDVRNHFQPGFIASKQSKSKKLGIGINPSSDSSSGVGTKRKAAGMGLKRAVAPGGDLLSDPFTEEEMELKGGEMLTTDDEGVAFCSTNQCGSDVDEKIIHPINYGYFSKSQPRQRFFLDRSSLAVTNQCIYLTLNTVSDHEDAIHLRQLPDSGDTATEAKSKSSKMLMVYFLTLLNSSTLQFFVLHTCQYDQQGRMRLFRESMAKIPFQDRDLRTPTQERMLYAVELGQAMLDLKEALYEAMRVWRIGETVTTAGVAGPGTPVVGGNQTLLDWIRRGGDIPAGVVSRTRDHVKRMLQQQLLLRRIDREPLALIDDTDTDSSSIATDTDTETDDNTGGSNRSLLSHSQLDNSTSAPSHHLPGAQARRSSRNDGTVNDGRSADTGNHSSSSLRFPHSAVAKQERSDQSSLWQADLPLGALSNPSPATPHPPVHQGGTQSSTTISAQNDAPNLETRTDRVLLGLERAMAMVEIVQWAVDQYGYSLYRVPSNFQILLETELNLVYSSALEECLQQSPVEVDHEENSRVIAVNADTAAKALAKLGISLPTLKRWDPTESAEEDVFTDSDMDSATVVPDSPVASLIPNYSVSILENARAAVQELKTLLIMYPSR